MEEDSGGNGRGGGGGTEGGKQGIATDPVIMGDGFFLTVFSGLSTMTDVKNVNYNVSDIWKSEAFIFPGEVSQNSAL